MICTEMFFYSTAQIRISATNEEELKVLEDQSTCETTNYHSEIN